MHITCMPFYEKQLLCTCADLESDWWCSWSWGWVLTGKLEGWGWNRTANRVERQEPFLRSSFFSTQSLSTPSSYRSISSSVSWPSRKVSYLSPLFLLATSKQNCRATLGPLTILLHRASLLCQLRAVNHKLHELDSHSVVHCVVLCGAR